MQLANNPYGKFYYFDADCIGQSVATGLFWDAWLKPYLDALQTDDVFVDVGASFGFYSVYAAMARKAIVHAFEPSPELCELLRMNASINGVDVNVHQLPLYDSEKELWLEQTLNQYPKFDDGTIDYEHTHNSAVLTFIPCEVGVAPPEKYKMLTQTLDSFQFASVAVLKIDTQGCDLRVLYGARKTIMRCRPVICFEHEPSLLAYHKDDWQGFLKFFDEVNYQVPEYVGGVDYVTKPKEGTR